MAVDKFGDVDDVFSEELDANANADSDMIDAIALRVEARDEDADLSYADVTLVRKKNELPLAQVAPVSAEYYPQGRIVARKPAGFCLSDEVLASLTDTNLHFFDTAVGVDSRGDSLRVFLESAKQTSSLVNDRLNYLVKVYGFNSSEVESFNNLLIRKSLKGLNPPEFSISGLDTPAVLRVAFFDMINFVLSVGDSKRFNLSGTDTDNGIVGALVGDYAKIVDEARKGVK
jgi:hypothetical protein